MEKILLKQLLLAHNQLALLYTHVNTATTPMQLDVYNSAAVRLLAEIRRLALAIRQYRMPPSRHFSVIYQQNVATGEAGQQVTYVDPAAAEAQKKSLDAQTEVRGNNEQPIGGRFAAHNEEPAACGCGTAERPEAEAVVA